MTAPILILDSRERWRPVGVEEHLRLHGYEWDAPEWRDLNQPARYPERLDFPAA